MKNSSKLSISKSTVIAFENSKGSTLNLKTAITGSGSSILV